MLHLYAPVLDTTGSTESATVVALPGNPFNLLMEIRKHPAAGYGDDAYLIPKGTPDKVFPGKVSAKALLQASKMKLQSEGVLEVLRPGDPGQEAVVRLRTSNVVLRTVGRGRPIRSILAPRTALAPVPGAIRINLKQHVRESALRVAEYGRLMDAILEDYSDIFESQFEPIRDAVSLRADRRRIENGAAMAPPNVCHAEER